MITATPIKTIARHYLSDLENAISNTWRAALTEEGFGYYAVNVRTNEAQQSVDNELDSLLHYRKLMCHYENTPDDIKDRERFLIDFAAPFYTRESLQQVIVPTQSFIPRVVRNVAMLYKEAAQRKLMGGVNEGGEAQEHAKNVEYQALIKGARINVKAKQWHRIYTLCDAVAVRPVVRTIRGKQVLQYDVIAPDSFRVALDADNNIRKVMYTSSLYDETGGIREYIVVVWTEDEHYYRDVNGKQGFFPEAPEGRNPYGLIPIVIMAKDEAQVFTGGMASLVESNVYANLLKMLESEDAAFSAISVPFGVNLQGKKDEQMTFNPRTPIFVSNELGESQDSELKYVSGEPHSELLRSLQEKEERGSAMRHGVAPFMLSDNPQELSGKAMKVALTELRELRQDDAMVFEAFERELYEITATVVNRETSIALPVDAEFFIDFGEQEYDDDPTAAYELDKQMLSDNLISIVDMYRKYLTGVESEEEVMKVIANNKRLNSLVRLPERAPAQAAGAALNQNRQGMLNGQQQNR